MKTYLIGYDLNKPHQDYPTLLEKLRTGFDAWWHYLDSTWIVKTNMTAVQIRDILQRYIDSNDELLVVALEGEGAWCHFGEDASKWLKDFLTPT